jgi:D-alanyl-D-alanine carboxypeptidase (penicillin-binding protein 5/6)
MPVYFVSKKQKLILFLNIIGILLFNLHQVAAQSLKPSVETLAPFAILIDAGTGTVLFEKSADAPMAPASMAKLATQEYVFNEVKSGRVSLDDVFTVSENAWRNGGAGSGGSTMFAQLNSRISVRDLLRGAIIISANDACIVLAENLAGSEPLFAQAITRRVKELGLTHSNFTNSTGLPDPNLRTTARDLSKLALYIIQNYPDFYKWYSEKEFSWETIKSVQFNRNPLLKEMNGADGVKTGYTEESGYGVVGSVLRDGRRLILVINGLKTAKDRADEARKLLEWGFRAFDNRRLFSAEAPVGEASVFAGERSSVPLVSQNEVSVLVPRTAQMRDIVSKVVYKGPVQAPIDKGQEIGKLQIYYLNTLLVERPLYAGESIAEGSMTEKALSAVKYLVRSLI